MRFVTLLIAKKQARQQLNLEEALAEVDRLKSSTTQYSHRIKRAFDNIRELRNQLRDAQDQNRELQVKYGHEGQFGTTTPVRKSPSLCHSTLHHVASCRIIVLVSSCYQHFSRGLITNENITRQSLGSGLFTNDEIGSIRSNPLYHQTSWPKTVSSKPQIWQMRSRRL
jgi:hypothetical protein